MYLPIQITSDTEPGIEIVEGLLDSGASGKFIDQDYARDIHAEKKDLPKPIKVYNVDGTPNKQGTITQYVELNLTIHKRQRKHRLYVTGLGNQQLILGYPWLKEMNPLIDWKKGTLEWRKWKHSALKKQPKESKTVEFHTYLHSALKKQPKERPPKERPAVKKQPKESKTVEFYTYLQRLIELSEPKKPNPEKKQPKRTPATIIEVEDEERHLNSTQNPLDENELSSIISSITGDTDNDVWINAKLNKATEIQAEINLKKKDLPLEEQVPKEFHEYLDVFSEEKAARFPRTEEMGP